jgi:hypothetical protein
MNSDGAIGPRTGWVQRSNAAAVGGEDRLIVDLKGSAGDGGFELAQDEPPLGVFALDRRLEAPHHAPAFALGGTQRKAGAAGQFLRCRAVVGRLREADGCAKPRRAVDENRT